LTEPTICVSISGGKDSTATAILALKQHGRDRVRLVHADVGNEHEITERFVRADLPAAFGMPIEIVRADFTKDIERKRRYIARHWAEKGVPAERIARALELLVPTGIPFLDLCMMKGRFPSRKAQFCTSELKRFPLDFWMLDRMAEGLTLESWQGVRRDESESRKNALAEEPAAEGWMIRRPIVDWTAQRVIDFIRAEGFPLNPLYSMGCERVGCMLCINAGKDEIANAARRWPHHIARLREWESLVSECSKGGFTTFFGDSAEDGETNAELFDRLRIDNRVLWATTSRGGRQQDMLRRLPSEVCASSYGLCE
jgi:3'-phosphoadenosine 5'-phosphosulfate sulfotransferase (PAPS reductase)/FAD synthetase